MRRALLVLLAILFPSVGLAERAIGIYADQYASECGIRDVAGPRTLYVVLKFNPGSRSSSFRVEESSGLTATLLSFSSPYAGVTGDPMSGIAIAHDGQCTVGDVISLELQMLFMGTSPPCSWLRIAGHPSSIDGEPEVYDCALNRHAATWLGIHVDPNLGCFCPGGTDHLCPACRPGMEPVATSSTTWGRIKALYR